MNEACFIRSENANQGAKPKVRQVGYMKIAFVLFAGRKPDQKINLDFKDGLFNIN